MFAMSLETGESSTESRNKRNDVENDETTRGKTRRDG